MSRDSVLGTFLVATVLCVVCALVVSTAAVSLKKKQDENRELDRKKNILLAAALCDKNATDKEVDKIYAKQIEEVLIDLDTGEPVGADTVDPKTYDPVKASKDLDLKEKITPKGELPGFTFREPYASVYKIVDGDQTQGYIFPVYGKGLWSTLYGFLALEADKTTVRGITFYKHGETPGLGGEVDNDTWKGQWTGKVIYQGDSQEVALEVLKGKVDGSSPDAVRQVDGLSGATITTKGVDNLVRYWLGPNAFGKYLAKL